MEVRIIRATCPTPVEREFLLQGPVVIIGGHSIVVCVNEFSEFLSRLYRAYCSLSCQSYGDAMRTTITCEVNKRKFFVKVVDGGLLYGEL